MSEVQNFVKYMQQTEQSEIINLIKYLSLPDVLRLQAALIEMIEIVEKRSAEIESQQ